MIGEHAATVIVTTPEGREGLRHIARQAPCVVRWSRMPGFHRNARLAQVYLGLGGKMSRAQSLIGAYIFLGALTWEGGAYVTWRADVP